jgi:hypothetical protein
VDELKKELNAVGNKKIWDVLKDNCQLFMCQGLTFNTEIPGYKTIFEGWNYDILSHPDYGLIERYLQHIKLYVCDNDDIIYNYVINWLSFLIQNPGKKTLTALVLISPQGAGKNTFVIPLLKIMAPYSKLIDKIDDITGRFNGVLENLVLGVINECRSDRKAKVDANGLKGIITEDQVRIENKGKDKRQAENVANLIFMSNNMLPFKQEVDDRRNLDLQCIKPEDPKWFDALYDIDFKDPLFEPTLLTYLSNHTIPEGFDFVKQLPMTALKRVIQSTYKNPFEQFITRHHREFVEGWESKSCRQTAAVEVINKMKDEDDKTYGAKGLTKDLQQYCGGAKERRIKGTKDKEWFYKLKPEYIESFRPTVEDLASGEYQQYLDEDAV